MEAIAHIVEIPFRGEYKTATQADRMRRSLLLEVKADGLSGWGEFPELPGYSPETVETALAAFKGRPVTHSNPLAIAAARMAWADLAARQQGRPLTEHLGATPGSVEVGAVVARLRDTHATVEATSWAIAAGFKKVKVKIAPGFDAEPLAAVRSTYPHVAMAADANGSYPGDADLRFLDGFDLAYLEQPLAPSAPWEASARLRAALQTRICLDEAITGPATARSAIAAGACDLMNLKPARLAGFETARVVHDLAAAGGVGLVAGGLLETAVGRSHALAFARLPGFTEASDLAPPSAYLETDLVALSHKEGVVVTPSAPGIGFDPDPETLDRYTIDDELIDLAVH
jgi:O-succinylbenzoate synthase